MAFIVSVASIQLPRTFVVPCYKAGIMLRVELEVHTSDDITGLLL